MPKVVHAHTYTQLHRHICAHCARSHTSSPSRDIDRSSTRRNSPMFECCARARARTQTAVHGKHNIIIEPPLIILWTASGRVRCTIHYTWRGLLAGLLYNLYIQHVQRARVALQNAGRKRTRRRRAEHAVPCTRSIANIRDIMHTYFISASFNKSSITMVLRAYSIYL